MKNRISASLVIAALFGVGAGNVLAGPTLLALRSESGATQTIDTNFGISQASLPFTATTTYDFYSSPLLAPTSLADQDKGGGVIYMKNTGAASANDFKVTGRMSYFDYDPATGTESLIVATKVSARQDVHHGQTVHWPLPNADLPASHTVPAGHLLHISVEIALVDGDPGSFGQLLYNGPSGATTVGQLPQNNHPTVWAFGNPVTPSLCLTRQPDGCARLGCAGLPGQTYLIQATTSLAAPQWTTIATNTTGLDGLFSFIDVNAPDYPCRFYRASTP